MEGLMCLCLPSGEGGQCLLQVTSNRTRGNGLTLCHGRFGLEIRKKLFMEKVVQSWHRLWRVPKVACVHLVPEFRYISASVKVLWKRPGKDPSWVEGSLEKRKDGYEASFPWELVQLPGWRRGQGCHARRDKFPAFWGTLWWACSSDFHLPFWIWWVAVGIPEIHSQNSPAAGGFCLQSKLCLQLWREAEDMTRAEWPRLLAVLYPAGTTFPAQKLLCLP